ncbi:MAG: hypothetical protein UHU21_07485 [Lachnospiraceae bacterium]|nr:hypothetical protein [Lachnospiraceae bacterium]
MKEKTYQQIRVISNNDPAEFQRLFNEAQTELASKNPKVQFNMTMGHCAYITYTETQKIPETMEDEFSLVGVELHCRNCPKFEWPLRKDGEIYKSKKRGTCPISMYGFTNRDSCACEYLYKGLASGKLQMIDDDCLEPYQID